MNDHQFNDVIWELVENWQYTGKVTAISARIFQLGLSLTLLLANSSLGYSRKLVRQAVIFRCQ